jgi:hypothetical protein
MAASTKPTAVHFSLVFFVMAALILTIALYLTGKEYATAVAAKNKSADDAAAAQNSLNKTLDEVAALKKRLGYVDFEAVGAETDSTPNTVLGVLNRDMTLYGKEQLQPNAANPTVAATLQSLRAALTAALADLNQRRTELATVQAELAQEKKAHSERAKKLQDSQTSSEDQLKQLVSQKNELVSEKDREISKWREEFRREQREREAVRDELDTVRKTLEGKVRDLENVVQDMREKLNALEDLSFDLPDGHIVQVDNTTRAVWIDVGADDSIRSQVSFSVYMKNHHGLGGSNGDIKAKIEVTKIRGPHLAEARILTEDLTRPIQIGDPIYSPVWSKGLKEYFSFVGVVDMDGDGKSDRELLHSVLENAGSGVEVEINDKGERVPEGGLLSVKSKFLVVGKIEDPTDYPLADADKQAEVRKVAQEAKELSNEALRKGIRTISFRDFLNYIGYEPQSRLYNATEMRPFGIKTGVRQTLIDDASGTQRLTPREKASKFKSETKPPASTSK